MNLDRDIFVQIVDEVSGYAISEIHVGRHNLNLLGKKIGFNIESLIDDGLIILDDYQIRVSKEYFGIDFDDNLGEVQIVSWSPEEDLPYRLHSNRELILMLQGLKPLSVFIGVIPENQDFQEIPDHLFDEHVRSGKFACREFCEPLQKKTLMGLRVVLYCLRGEEWRLDAYILLRSIAKKTGWNESLLRMEGYLLGYSEWENNEFIKRTRYNSANSKNGQ